jgi:hypothetical protein
MKRRLLPLSMLLLAACATAPGVPPAPRISLAPVDPPPQEEDDDSGGVVSGILLYLPNRLFDLLDVVRARVRVGPGLALDLRATEFADLYLGAYTSVFVGLPGPRGEPEINWPFGIESLAGVEVSVADASTGVGTDPGYGSFEFGIGVQAFLVGFDVGVDPWEALDFVAGLVTLDPGSDDL